MKFSSLMVSIVAVAMAAIAAPAAKADTTYLLTGLTFDDGTPLSGYFTTNVYGQITFKDVTTVDGSIDGYHYDNTINSGVTPHSVTFYRDVPHAYEGFIVLTYLDPLGGSGTDSLIGGLGGPSYECDTYSCAGPSANVRYLAVTGGVLAVGSAPEPAAWGLMLLGLGVAGAGLRRARRPMAA